ncbi:MAG: hypothetical protein CMG20_03745 [Candidatus Marinimicrobia bacterium]|jgi:hypothetical protein|nr:hypothetical protein [Candidatus Neomarinimicrobiota bacterium]|tara:strand:- start:7292 stop:7570 length:279 start_codon:yes stop_codon:yes gene_type:complete
MSNRNISLISVGILAGAMIGTALGQFLGYVLPEGSTVKQFFLTTFDFSFGSIDSGLLVDLGVIALDFGFILRFNVCSVIGFAIAYYLLKYFR